MTYNHAPYIEEALNGFTMQQTSFPFVCTIVDDCSTDGEQDVIRKYLEENFDLLNDKILRQEETEDYFLIFAQHKKNTNCYFATVFLKYNHYHKKDRLGYIAEWLNSAKYTALCEGDDYWIEPKKLQMQADFMETHPDYGLIHTNFDSIPVKRITSSVSNNKKDEYLVDMLNGDYSIATLTTMYRASLLKKLPNYSAERKFKMGDLPRWLEFANVSKIKYIDCVTAIYRITENSASHNKDIQKELDFYRSSMECRLFYADKFNVKIKNQLPMFYDAAIKSAFNHRLPDEARMLLQQAKVDRALSLKAYLFYLGTKKKIIRRIINRFYNR